jgi:hypothetical protein
MHAVSLSVMATATAVDNLRPLFGHLRGQRIPPAHFVERLGPGSRRFALGTSVVACSWC